MNPGHHSECGKHKAFHAVGWELSTLQLREKAAGEVIGILRASLPPADVRLFSSAYGTRYETRTVLKGPNGRVGSLIVIWQVAPSTVVPRLITNWFEVHKEIVP
jgi:hypothetical protein